MTVAHEASIRVVLDGSPRFVYAVSLMAALEGAVGTAEHRHALPLLGLARTELVDFGQRIPTHFVEVAVDDVIVALYELDGALTDLIATSHVLRHTLRVHAARDLVREILEATGRVPPSLAS